jgi:glycosyltransferase involved in cell wall biosynthesis
VPSDRFGFSHQPEAIPHLPFNGMGVTHQQSDSTYAGFKLRNVLPSKTIGAFLSVIIPAHNESGSLDRLTNEVHFYLSELREYSRDCMCHSLAGFEIIIVDDGSTDSTWSILSQLTVKYGEVRPLRLDRNAGQSAAIAAGLHIATGNWIATLDADLQNDPADLTRLWNALPGFDVVLGWRARRADNCSKRIISRVANRVRNLTLRQAIRDTGCSVRLFPRSIALRLPLFHGFHRFLGPLLLREGCRIIQVPVHHRPRAVGRSHYNMWNRSIAVVIDLIGVIWLKHRALKYSVQSSGAAYTITPCQSAIQQIISHKKNLEVA